MTKDEVLLSLREVWADKLQEGEALDVQIRLRTPSGGAEQPLLYDIRQTSAGDLVTYTWVEQPATARAALGLAAVSQEQALRTLRDLLVEAHYAVTPRPLETTLTAEMRAEGVGRTFGRHLFADGQVRPWETDYRFYFTCELLRTMQAAQSGLTWERVGAMVNTEGRFSVEFG